MGEVVDTEEGGAFGEGRLEGGGWEGAGVGGQKRWDLNGGLPILAI